MKLGFYGFNYGTLCDPDKIVAVLTAAEEAGFDSAWIGEHLVLIDPHDPRYPFPPETPLYDIVAALSYAAAVTTTLKLGSGIILLAQHNPVVLAKELTTIDALSKGRLIFGVGVGRFKEEFDAIGVPFEERGARVNEHIEAIRTLWTQEKPEFNGRFTQISGVQQNPHPTQKPHPPIIVGGMSEVAYARTIKHGDGWFGLGLTEEQTAASIADLEAAAKKAGDADKFNALEITVGPSGELTPDRVKAYQDLGVHRLVVMPPLFYDPNTAADDAKTAADDAKRLIEASAEALG